MTKEYSSCTIAWPKSRIQILKQRETMSTSSYDAEISIALSKELDPLRIVRLAQTVMMVFACHSVPMRRTFGPFRFLLISVAG